MTENGKTSLRPLTRWPSPKKFAWPRKSSDGRHGRPRFQLETSAPFVGGNCSLTKNEAAILGWVLSDGSIYRSKKHNNKIYGVSIVQSKKKFFEDISDLLKEEKIYKRPYKKKNDCYAFNVSANYFRNIWAKAKLDERTFSDLVLDMSSEARSAWFDSIYKAEGTLGRNYIAQNKGELLEAMALSAFLEGRNEVQIRSKTEKCGAVTWHNKNRTPRRCVVENVGEKSDVWCPNTELGSWTARTKEGNIFLTGNTWWIKQAVNNYLLNINPVIRVPSHIKAAQNKLAKKLKLTNKDLVDIYDIDPKEYDISPKMLRSIQSAIKSRHVSSLQNPAYLDDDGTSTMEDLVPCKNTSAASENIDQELVSNAIKDALKSMSEKRRLILLLRYDVIQEADVPKRKLAKAKKMKMQKKTRAGRKTK